MVLKSAWLSQLGRSVFYALRSKHEVELGYWKKVYREAGGKFSGAHYKTLMLAMADETDDSFLSGKVVADFGCGPQGSLSWIKSSSCKIGIDILAAKYWEQFPLALNRQQMVYLTSTEEHIPLPDGFVDVLFTINALDHVANLEQMSREINRIIKPGGLLIGSFNLNNPPTKAEPVSLTEDLLRQKLFAGFEITKWLVSAAPRQGYLFGPLIDKKPIPISGKAGIVWVIATKKGCRGRLN